MACCRFIIFPRTFQQPKLLFFGRCKHKLRLSVSHFGMFNGLLWILHEILVLHEFCMICRIYACIFYSCQSKNWLLKNLMRSLSSSLIHRIKVRSNITNEYFNCMSQRCMHICTNPSPFTLIHNAALTWSKQNLSLSLIRSCSNYPFARERCTQPLHWMTCRWFCLVIVW